MVPGTTLTLLKGLSHLNDLANLCRFIKKFPNTFAHANTLFVSFVYVNSTLKNTPIGCSKLSLIVVLCDHPHLACLKFYDVLGDLAHMFR